MIYSHNVKRIALESGAHIVGIAPVDRYIDAPEGFHPQEIFKKCRCVLSLGISIPKETLTAKSRIPYSHMYYFTIRMADTITYQISYRLQELNIGTVPIPADDPCDYIEKERGYVRGIISLRHSAYLAGLGYLGRNTLLINKKYGNMLTLGAILLDVELEGDFMQADDKCPNDCRICLDQCQPVALDGNTVNQQLCRPFSTTTNELGLRVKSCYACRQFCPRKFGY